MEALDDVQIIEKYTSAALRGCTKGAGGPVNPEKAIRILRTCVIAAFEAQVAYYSSLPSYHPEWIIELSEKTIDSLIGLFPLFTPGEEFRDELFLTLKDHLRAKAKAANAKPPKVIDRKKLRDLYLANFSGVKILDVCWAAGQHYSEWKRWLRRAVKDGSAPDRAFRLILTSGKAPNEYRDKPRPEGWK